MARFLSALLLGAVVSAEDSMPESWNSADEVGLQYLKKSLVSDGYSLLPSGMLYTVMKSGEGTKAPTASTSCDVHYAGTLIGGKEFDSSIKRGQPTTFAPNQVIKGWTEALQLMGEGDKWQVVIPPSMAYGERGAGGAIPPKATLIFTIEIVSINGSETVPKPVIEHSSWMPEDAGKDEL